MISGTEVIELAARCMEQRGHAVTRHDTWLQHRDSGLVITPLLLESHPSKALVRSLVVVTTSHPRLPRDGVLEYQHAVGETLSAAVSSGFDQWTQVDFVVFLDALRDRPEQCQTFEIEFPRDPGSALTRRAVLGPVGHLAAHPERAADDAGHPFCPCCLLTNTFAAFQPFVEADGFFGEVGSTQADCRVNGHDWESGKHALRRYAETWPQAGFELRKQYVILQTLSAPGRL